ncbi:MAG: hypothetical protein U9Q70_04470 [Chloroflexota bacterium]|nr:hypothetical protein [Chloroflexota bacterium]
MKFKPRTAQAGDVCVLLEPRESERVRLRQLQEGLPARFGGRPHRNVHFTTQRFLLSDKTSLSPLVVALQSALLDFPPFRVVAEGLRAAQHAFWGTCLLRWRIRNSEPLEDFLHIVDATLLAQRVTPHFPSAVGWRPTLVTALEGVTECDVALASAPSHLFTASRVVLSQIRGRDDFKILAVIQLTKEEKCSL